MFVQTYIYRCVLLPMYHITYSIHAALRWSTVSLEKCEYSHNVVLLDVCTLHYIAAILYSRKRCEHDQILMFGLHASRPTIVNGIYAALHPMIPMVALLTTFSN